MAGMCCGQVQRVERAPETVNNSFLKPEGYPQNIFLNFITFYRL